MLSKLSLVLQGTNLEQTEWLQSRQSSEATHTGKLYLKYKDFDPLDGSICCGTQLAGALLAFIVQSIFHQSSLDFRVRKYVEAKPDRRPIALLASFLVVVVWSPRRTGAETFGSAVAVWCWAFCLGGMLSFQGRCFTYDRSADGYLRGEADLFSG